MAEPKAVERETPEPERLAVGIESLLHDWGGAYERARAYLVALGLTGVDLAVRAVADSATASRRSGRCEGSSPVATVPAATKIRGRFSSGDCAASSGRMRTGHRRRPR